MIRNTLNPVPSTQVDGDLVKVCSDRHIEGHTEKAIKVRIGSTLYGDPIFTFYPKSMVRTKPNRDGGYDVFVPKWVNRDRRCTVGVFDVNDRPGFNPLPF